MTTEHASELSAGAQRLLADIDRVVREDDYDGNLPSCCLLGQVARSDPRFDEERFHTCITAFIATTYNIPRHAVQEIYSEATEDEYAHNLPAAKAMAARILELTHA